eukprot:gene1224-1345_t
MKLSGAICLLAGLLLIHGCLAEEPEKPKFQVDHKSGKLDITATKESADVTSREDYVDVVMKPGDQKWIDSGGEQRHKMPDANSTTSTEKSNTMTESSKKINESSIASDKGGSESSVEFPRIINGSSNTDKEIVGSSSSRVTDEVDSKNNAVVHKGLIELQKEAAELADRVVRNSNDEKAVSLIKQTAEKLDQKVTELNKTFVESVNAVNKMATADKDVDTSKESVVNAFFGESKDTSHGSKTNDLQNKNKTNNLEKNEDKTNNLEKNEDKTSNLEQNKDKTSNLEQNKDKTSNLEQNKDKTNNLEKNEDKTNNLEQNKDKESNLEQNKDKESNFEQNKDKESNLEQSKDKAGNVEQNKDNASNLEQNKDKESNLEQNKDKESNLEQSKDKAGNVEQNKDNASNLEQNKDKESNLEQNKDKESNLEQSKDKAGNVEQNKDKESNLEQSKDKAGNVEQNKDNASNLEQNKEKASNLEQSKDKASNLEQSKDKQRNSEQNKDKASNLEQSKDKAGNVEQNKDNASNLEQNKEKESNFEQNKDKESNLEQSKDKAGNVEQNKDNASNLEQNKDKESNFEQNKDKESNLEQSKDKAGNVEQNKDKASIFGENIGNNNNKEKTEETFSQSRSKSAGLYMYNNEPYDLEDAELTSEEQNIIGASLRNRNGSYAVLSNGDKLNKATDRRFTTKTTNKDKIKPSGRVEPNLTMNDTVVVQQTDDGSDATSQRNRSSMSRSEKLKTLQDFEKLVESFLKNSNMEEREQLLKLTWHDLKNKKLSSSLSPLSMGRNLNKTVGVKNDKDKVLKEEESATKTKDKKAKDDAKTKDKTAKNEGKTKDETAKNEGKTKGEKAKDNGTKNVSKDNAESKKKLVKDDAEREAAKDDATTDAQTKGKAAKDKARMSKNGMAQDANSGVKTSEENNNIGKTSKEKSLTLKIEEALKNDMEAQKNTAAEAPGSTAWLKNLVGRLKYKISLLRDVVESSAKKKLMHRAVKIVKKKNPYEGFKRRKISNKLDWLNASMMKKPSKRKNIMRFEKF